MAECSGGGTGTDACGGVEAASGSVWGWEMRISGTVASTEVRLPAKYEQEVTRLLNQAHRTGKIPKNPGCAQVRDKKFFVQWLLFPVS
jgi:hypothetical protein